MKIKSTEIVDTFAEAFTMWSAEIIITAKNNEWALAAAQSITGFATSVIGCKCEAGINKKLGPKDTPDQRPGYSILIFSIDKNSLEKRLIERIGQCVMTCPTTSCFSGFSLDQSVNVGGALRYFGDGYQISKKINGRRIWRIPVMDGEFVIDELFGIKESVGGGNFYLLGKSPNQTLTAAKKSTEEIKKISGCIMPFPNGVVRSGSKVGSKYKTLPASTNELYCPTLKGIIDNSSLSEKINCVLEIVIDAIDYDTLSKSMKVGIKAGATPGIHTITAGNFDGKLGQHKIYLKDLIK